jgi:hypothetical protein
VLVRTRTPRTAVAALVPVAVLLPATAAGHAAARTATCAQRELAVEARAVSADPTVVRVRVTSRAGHGCTVDPIPTVTFGNLDGTAQPVPAGPSGPSDPSGPSAPFDPSAPLDPSGSYRLDPGRTAYAAVRTVTDPTDPSVRRVDTLTVAAHPAHRGRTFTAAALGAGSAIRVWEPVTTRWQASAAAADRAIGLSR